MGVQAKLVIFLELWVRDPGGSWDSGFRGEGAKSGLPRTDMFYNLHSCSPRISRLQPF